MHKQSGPKAEQLEMAEELLFSGPATTSFAKRLYFGVFDAARVLPFPTVSPDERRRVDELVDRVKAFADAHIDAAAIDRAASIPEKVIKGLGELGVLGLTIPREYAGLGHTQYGYCRVMEELSRRCGSTSLFVNAHQSIGLKALVLFGTEDQRKRYLPKLARGEHLAAFSLTEPTAGSDAAGVKTRAVFDPDRNVYRITGQKQWTTNGSLARVLTVMAKTEVPTPAGPKDKITAFIVTPDMPGFKVTAAALDKVGMRGSTTSNLAFDNLEVPADNVLGPLGGGLKVALTVLDYGRTTFGATCTGAAKEAYERALAHARTRYQFDRPLASFGLVKEKLATMAGLVYAMDAATYLTAGLLDRGDEDFMIETAMLKVFTSDSLWTILYESMQILGGRSFFCDAPFERMMRDARLNMIGEGANEVLRVFIGLAGMRDVGRQLEGVARALRRPVRSAMTLSRFGGRLLKQRFTPVEVPVRSPRLQTPARDLGGRVRRFGRGVRSVLVRHRENVVERQAVLDRIATAAMAIYTSTAVLSKLDAALSSAGDSDRVERDLAVGTFYCRRALSTIDRALDGLLRNDDADVESVADRLSGLGSRTF